MNAIILNQSTCKDLSFDELLTLSKDFNGLELNFEYLRELEKEGYDKKEILESLETYNLEAMSIFKLKNFSLCSQRTFKTEIVPKLQKMLKWCYKLGCRLILVEPSTLEKFENPEHIPQWRIVRRTKEKLEEICKIAYEWDVKIGFEFKYSEYSSIRTLPQTKKVMKPLEHIANLGYAIDLFEFAKSQGTLTQLSDINALIFLVQLCDLNYAPQRKLIKMGNERRLPLGQGDYPIKKFMKTLRKMNYRNPFSLELYDYDCSKKLSHQFKKIRHYL
ncbi:MAG: sugar phosphate isomerase/epimerase family protein [Promethearchaeia archaeon]